jgi:hypothetical protein
MEHLKLSEMMMPFLARNVEGIPLVVHAPKVSRPSMDVVGNMRDMIVAPLHLFVSNAATVLLCPCLPQNPIGK